MPVKINWLMWGVVINFIMLLLLAINVFNIAIPFPSITKAEYTISTLDEPQSSEMLPALKTSDLYYVELIVDTPSSITWNDIFTCSIKTENKGKKTVGEPEFRIFIVDSIGNVRGIYPSQMINCINYSLTNLLLLDDSIKKEESEEGIKFKFNMPPEDQKVIGNWKIFVYLFDKSSQSLVSYNVCEFEITRPSSPPYLFAGIITGFIFAVISELIKEYRKKN